jgi:hypothetical protein
MDAVPRREAFVVTHPDSISRRLAAAAPREIEIMSLPLLMNVVPGSLSASAKYRWCRVEFPVLAMSSQARCAMKPP